MWSADNDLLNLKKDYGITIPHLVDLQSKYRVGFIMRNNGSQLKNSDISGALYTLRIQYLYTQTQCEDGARDVRVL